MDNQIRENDLDDVLSDAKIIYSSQLSETENVIIDEESQTYKKEKVGHVSNDIDTVED